MGRQRGGGLVTLQARAVSPRLTRPRSGHTLAGMRTAAIAAALALTACSDHDEGADLPDRLEFNATGSSAEGPGAEVICGGVGMPWALTIMNVVRGPAMITSLRNLGDYACERDGLAVECIGAANGGAAPTELSIALSEDGRSGVGRYAFEGSASVRCSANFDLAAR